MTTTLTTNTYRLPVLMSVFCMNSMCKCWNSIALDAFLLKNVMFSVMRSARTFPGFIREQVASSELIRKQQVFNVVECKDLAHNRKHVYMLPESIFVHFVQEETRTRFVKYSNLCELNEICDILEYS